MVSHIGRNTRPDEQFIRSDTWVLSFVKKEIHEFNGVDYTACPTSRLPPTIGDIMAWICYIYQPGNQRSFLKIVHLQPNLPFLESAWFMNFIIPGLSQNRPELKPVYWTWSTPVGYESLCKSYSFLHTKVF